MKWPLDFEFECSEVSLFPRDFGDFKILNRILSYTCCIHKWWCENNDARILGWLFIKPCYSSDFSFNFFKSFLVPSFWVISLHVLPCEFASFGSTPASMNARTEQNVNSDMKKWASHGHVHPTAPERQLSSWFLWISWMLNTVWCSKIILAVVKSVSIIIHYVLICNLVGISIPKSRFSHILSFRRKF